MQLMPLAFIENTSVSVIRYVYQIFLTILLLELMNPSKTLLELEVCEQRLISLINFFSIFEKRRTISDIANDIICGNTVHNLLVLENRLLNDQFRALQYLITRIIYLSEFKAYF